MIFESDQERATRLSEKAYAKSVQDEWKRIQELTAPTMASIAAAPERSPEEQLEWYMLMCFHSEPQGATN